MLMLCVRYFHVCRNIIEVGLLGRRHLRLGGDDGRETFGSKTQSWGFVKSGYRMMCVCVSFLAGDVSAKC